MAQVGHDGGPLLEVQHVLNLVLAGGAPHQNGLHLVHDRLALLEGGVAEKNVVLWAHLLALRQHPPGGHEVVLSGKLGDVKVRSEVLGVLPVPFVVLIEDGNALEQPLELFGGGQGEVDGVDLLVHHGDLLRVLPLQEHHGANNADEDERDTGDGEGSPHQDGGLLIPGLHGNGRDRVLVELARTMVQRDNWVDHVSDNLRWPSVGAAVGVARSVV